MAEKNNNIAVRLLLAPFRFLMFFPKLIIKILGLFIPLVGEFTWSAPRWFKQLQDLSNRFALWRESNRTSINKGAMVILIAGAVSVAGYTWYLSMPKPVEFTVSGTSPGPTALKENAKPDPIQIYFSGSAAQLNQVGKTISQGVKIDPEIKGQWRWDSDTQITFTPSEDWAVGEDYSVDLAKTLFPDHVHLEDYEYEFSSAPFVANITQSVFHQDPTDPKLKKVVATVKFSHAVNTADFESRIKLQLDQDKKFLGTGKQFSFTVSYDKFKGEAYIHSERVAIPPKDTYMVLKIDDGVRAAAGGPSTDREMTSKVWIPGMLNYFRVQRATATLVRNERYEPEQVLIIEATAGVTEKDLRENLSVYLLPDDKPAFQGQKAVEDYTWHDPAEIGPEVLKYAERAKLDALPTDREYANLHSFKYKADVGDQLLIRIKKGVKSFGGYVLAKEYDQIVTVPPYPRELNIMHDGALLSLAGDKKLSVFSRGVDAVKFEIGRVMPKQVNHLVSQTGGQFKSPQFENQNFDQDNIVQRFSEVRILKNLGKTKAQYTAFDFSDYLSGSEDGIDARGLFFLRVQDWDPVNEETLGMQDERLILVTDLGVVIKDNADKSHQVFVQSLSSGNPVAGARVLVLGRNGLPISETTTNERGHTKIPQLDAFKREKAPTVYVVKRGKDLSFMPYDRRDRELNFSRFDIGGETTAGRSGELNAFLFSDRGIYRPGDTFHIGMIVKHSDWRHSLSGVPLETVIKDSRGLVIQKRKIRLSSAGFEEITYTTEETAPTGDYEASVYVIKDKHRRSLLGSTTVRVEEFLPDRLEITTRYSTERERGWVSPQDLKGQVRLKNLFGTAAINRRVAAEITLSPTYPVFGKYRSYTFFDPLKAKKSFTERLPDERTNDDGEATFTLGLEKFDKATYRLNFLAQGFEAEGGRGVSSDSNILVSPLQYLIGYKADGELRYVTKNSKRSVNIIAIDPKLNMTGVDKLKAQLIEIKHVSVLTRQPDGTYKYQSVKKEIKRESKELSITKKGLTYVLNTKEPGDYALVIQSTEDTKLSRIEYNVVGHANLTRDLEKNSELQVKLNKKDYLPGETIEMQIKAPYTGAGLITIERDRVYQYKWFKTNTTSTVQTITVPHNLEGNGYVNVTFLRSMSSKEVFMSPLSYGVSPFSVSKEKRRVKIKLDIPEIARPGEPFRIKFSADKSSRIAIFAVDEGILQVASYTTPRPLKHFFKKRALEVSTAQILDLLLPEFELMKSLSSEGGGYAEEAIGKNLNPFKRRRDKPVAFWSGIVEAGTDSREVTYQVPDYFNGTLRVMAVAVAPDSVGSSAKKAIVRGHFVLSPNVPTFVAPGDRFEISVGVANNLEDSGKDAKIMLKLETSKHVEVSGEKERVLTISEGKETSVTFSVLAKDILGSGNFTFTASKSGKKARYSVDLSIRPPIPYITTVESGSIKDTNVVVKVPRKMYPQFRTNDVSVSHLPLGLARGLDKYLAKFPYGCTEQLVSKAFPALVLRHRPEFGYKQKKAQANLERAMRILQARQNAEGAFGFWAANSHVSNYQTVYALHFLTEAKDKNYPIPDNVLKKGLSYLRTIAESEPDRLSEFRTKAYAIYILTRNGVVTTRYIAGIRDQLKKEKELAWKTDLTGAYLASSYAMLKLKRDANSIMDDIKIGQAQEIDYRYFYDNLSRDAQVLYLMANHFPDRLEDFSGKDLAPIVKAISSGGFNTLSSAYSILGLDAYASVVGDPKAADTTISEILKDDKTKALVLRKGLFPNMAFSDKAEKIKIDSKGPYSLYYQTTQAGFNKTKSTKELKKNLEVQREYRDSDGDVVKEVKLGEEIQVHIKLRAVDLESVSNVAVVDLLPGGFEVVLDGSVRSGVQSDGSSSGISTWSPEYVDIREDRVVIFGTVGQKAKEFVYRIKATNKGSYTVPPTFGGSMYNRNVMFRGTSSSIKVTDKD